MEPIEQQDKETSDALTISAEKAFFIIVKAREFDEKVAPSDPGSGSNPSDDKEVDVLEAGDDATLQELAAALTGLNEDEQLDLVGLMWLRRGRLWHVCRGAAAGGGHDGQAHPALSDRHTATRRLSRGGFGDSRNFP